MSAACYLLVLDSWIKRPTPIPNPLLSLPALPHRTISVELRLSKLCCRNLCKRGDGEGAQKKTGGERDGARTHDLLIKSDCVQAKSPNHRGHLDHPSAGCGAATRRRSLKITRIGSTDLWFLRQPEDVERLREGLRLAGLPA